MKNEEYVEIKKKADRLISFILWKGASFESKEKKVIKEIALIKQFCLKNIDKENPDLLKQRQSVE